MFFIKYMHCLTPCNITSVSVHFKEERTGLYYLVCDSAEQCETFMCVLNKSARLTFQACPKQHKLKTL